MDPIADLLTQIRNSVLAKKEYAKITSSKLKETILRAFKELGYISDFKVISKKNKKTIEINLKYNDKIPAINYIKRISTPGRRVYTSWHNIPRPMGGAGSVIMSTPLGVMDGVSARKKKVGGEIICEVF